MQKNKTFLILIIVMVALLGCKEKDAPKKFVAKVGNEYLLQKDVAKFMAKTENSKKYTEEFVRDWVETQMLYKEAINQNVVNDSVYKAIVLDMKKELAAALLLEKVEKQKINISRSKLDTFFDANKNDFRTLDDAVVVNYIKFSKEQSAIKFRNILLNSNWESALEKMRTDSTVVDIKNQDYLYYSEISPPVLLRYIQNLNPGEISIVIKINPNVFAVVQVKAFLKKGSVPELSFIINQVKKRYLMLRKKKLLHDYINKLYSKYEVELRIGS